MFVIGLAQIDIVWENKIKNYSKIESFFQTAQKQKVQFIIFPEMVFTGFTMNTAILDIAANELKWIINKCKQYCMYAGVGYALKENNISKNCFAIISPNGEIISNYTKIHLFSHADEQNYYRKGNEIVFANINDFCVSTFLCYDLRFPEIFQYSSSKANMLIIAANWPKVRINHWRNLLISRAIETQSYVVGVNRTGATNSIEYTGASMIINPYGEIISEISNEEKLIIGNADINDVIKVRDEFNTKRDCQISFYRNLYKEYLN